MEPVATSSDNHLQISVDETLLYSPPREPDTDDTISRLYFGPQNSPEKRLINSLVRNNEDTPLRRSPALTTRNDVLSPSPRPADLIKASAEGEAFRFENCTPDLLDSGRGTPDVNQDLQDEPSSALADRIIRAHDNPSPPPNSQDPFITEADSVSPRLRPFYSRSPLGIPDLSLPSSHAILAPEETPGNTSGPDLISFASVSTPAPTLRELPSNEVDVPAPIPSIDYLLSRSPSNQLDNHTVTEPSQQPYYSDPFPSNHQEASNELEKERATASQSSVTDDLVPGHELPLEQLYSQPQESLHLRRSKRHSSSPSPHLDNTDSINVPLKPIAPLRLHTRMPNNSPTPFVDSEDRQTALNNDEWLGRKRKRHDGDQAMIGTSRLGSLSPSSTSILQQLIPLTQPESDVKTVKASQEPVPSHFPLRVPLIPRLSSPGKFNRNANDSNRTPAKRVPIAPMAGQLNSPQKGQPGTRTFGGAVFRIQSLDDPARSPVRRVLIADPSSPKKDVLNATAFPKERGLSSSSRSTIKGRSASAEPVFSRPPVTSRHAPTALPYPIVQKPAVIPEEDEANPEPSPVKQRATSAPPVVPPTLIRSNLKQPTITSRIPRIGAKPYARPPGSDKTKLPVPASRTRPITNVVRPFGGNGSGSGSGSDDSNSSTAATSTLKRKWGMEQKTTASVKLQPVVMRQVPGIRAHERAQLPPPTVTEAQRSSHASSEGTIPTPMPTSADDAESPETRTRSSSRLSHPPQSVEKHADIGISEQYGLRRTSRSRRPPSTGDASSNSKTPAAVLKPAPVKKRPPSEAGFAGMSSLALKTLTTNNTLRNQQIVNTIETELIRKEGQRPESPTTKLRTISEKQKEQKAHQRKERAERRARKLESGEIAEDDMDLSFMSDLPVGDDDKPLKHRRGPGEDEDYETPERPVRPPKRSKVEGSEQDESEEVKDRRVQWDRSLFTSVYLDDLPEKLEWPKTRNTGRSCLAKTVKAVRLDPLGNVQTADMPITQLTTERVVIKRFVYEGEDIPEVHLPEVKPLRVSKGRKAKS